MTNFHGLLNEIKGITHQYEISRHGALHHPDPMYRGHCRKQQDRLFAQRSELIKQLEEAWTEGMAPVSTFLAELGIHDNA